MLSPPQSAPAGCAGRAARRRGCERVGGIIRLVAAGLLLGWIPGALALRLPIPARHRRERLDWDERLFWAVVLSAAWSVAAVFTLAVFGRYSFERVLTLNAAVAILVLLTARSRLKYLYASRPRLGALVLALLFGFALWLYRHSPCEYIIVAADPGCTSTRACRSRSAATS